MRNTWIVALLVMNACLSLAAGADTLPEWTGNIRRDHPRLFFNVETWPAVRQRALVAEQAWFQKVKRETDALAERLARTAEPAPEELGPQAARAAFVFLVTEERRYLETARKSLQISVRFYEQCFQQRKTVNWYSTSRMHAVCAWDWLYNHLSETERTELLARLVQVIDNVLQAKPTIYRENMSGYDTGFYGVRNCLWFLGCTAFGTGIETERINRWLVWGHDENLRMLEHRRRACGDDGGGASPTVGYIFGAYPWAEQNFFYTWLSATGENLAPQWPHGAWLANYLVWNWIAGDPVPYEFGYGDTYHTDGTLRCHELYSHMANIRHVYAESAPDAAGLARHLQSKLPQQQYASSWFIYPFLLSKLDQSPPALDPKRLPKARHFEGMGQVFLRSGTGLDDTYALFTCGGLLSQHRHYDALNFVIYHRGFLALDSGTRHDEVVNGQHLANYYAQTVAHNCVLIHQPSEPPARYWGGTVEANHGGQHRQIGSVLKAFHTSDDYVYVAGDATACYQRGVGRSPSPPGLGEKCSLVTRQLVFLIPNHFVVFDRVVATDPKYRKDWLIHTAYEPQIVGRTIRADHGRGRMFCRTLLPADAVFTAVGGPGKEFLAAGKNWSIEATGLRPEQLAMMGQWRVEVTPGSGRAEDVFLHVIQVGDQVLDAMDPVELVQSDGVCGVRLSKPNETWTVTFRTEADLGGQLICADGKNAEYDLANTVQPQSGIMGNEK